jgi:metal-dependent amidase/aminoacylase/carboxypeptidase family protein
VRAYKESVRKTIELQVLELSAAVASAFGAAVEIRYRRNYPPSINDAALAQTVAGVAESVVGGGNVLRNSLPSMAAEDFSFFTQERPGCYVWMGNDGDAHSHSLHRPMYDLNDQLLPLGVSYWTELVGRLMPLEHCLK